MACRTMGRAVALLPALATASVLVAQAPESMLPVGTNVMVGRVLERGSDDPVPGALVSLTGYLDSTGRLAAPGLTFTENFYARSGTKHVWTNSEGYFVFQSLAAGRYTIAAEAFGYRHPDYQPRLVELREQTAPTQVTLRLWRYGSITGRVFDERGEPVVGAPVAVLRRMGGGRSPAMRSLGPEATTDDRGVYRIAELPPGSYIVGAVSMSTTLPAGVGAGLDAAAASGSRSSAWLTLRDSGGSRIRSGEGTRIGDFVLQRRGPPAVLGPDGHALTYPTTLYPGTSSAVSAEPVTVGSGESISGVDIPVSYSRTATVSGVATGPDGPVPNLLVRLLPPDSTAALTSDTVPALGAVTDGSGAFVFLAVPPGEYLLSTVSSSLGSTHDGAESGVTLWALRPVIVGGTDVSDITVRLSAGLRISGRVVFAEASEPALTEDQRVMVWLRPFGAGTGRGRSMETTVRSDGSFTTRGVPPGRYQIAFSITCLTVGACPSTWKWRSTTLDGMRLAYDMLDLRGGDLSGVEATFAERSTRVAGSIVDAAGLVDSDADVIVFPADTTLWREETFSRRVRNVHATVGGEFEIQDLPPGEYYLAAVSGPYPVAEPDALERLVRDASRLTLRDGEQANVRLSSFAPGTR